MKISEIIESTELFQQPIKMGIADNRPDMSLSEDDLEEGPLLDKAKKVAAGATLGLAAMAPQAHADTKSFNANAGDPKYVQMQELQDQYYQEMLQAAKESGTPLTADVIRRLRMNAQLRAVEKLST
jgi:hypothetical protein